jgi:hypothetical protein
MGIKHGSAFAFCPLVLETGSLSWSELARRTWREVVDDDVLGPRLSSRTTSSSRCFRPSHFYSLASFFLLSNITDDVGRSLGPFVSPQVLVGAAGLAMAAVLVARRRDHS